MARQRGKHPIDLGQRSAGPTEFYVNGAKHLGDD